MASGLSFPCSNSSNLEICKCSSWQVPDHVVTSLLLSPAGNEVTSTVLQPLLVGVLKGIGKGSILAEEGGSFLLSKSWVNKLCVSLNLPMRRTTTGRKLPEDWVEQVRRTAITFNCRLTAQAASA